MKKVMIIGGGLAGCEAAYQLASRGIPVELFEMKPGMFSPAHETEGLAELVCSNSLRSNAPDSAVGLLKEEMRSTGSLLMQVAEATQVPAGKALAVDRKLFSQKVTETMVQHELITLRREEVTSLPGPDSSPVILATGPLTSDSLARDLQRLTGQQLAFYDAIAPIVSAESLDKSLIYRKSRWDDDGPGDYLNCPMTEAQYEHFITLLQEGETVPLKDFEDAKFFEGCLPVEVMCSRGKDTLRFGPMKPVGLAHPETGEVPFAVVQLRAENREETMYNLVGFQTKLTYPAQKQVFSSIPGLEHAEFLRYGSIHRNTFICAPSLLQPSLQLQEQSNLFIAGQLSGVEGYVESIAMGMLAGINCACLVLHGQVPSVPPPGTALGALINHLTQSDPRHFQPSNVNFGLFPPLQKKMRKRDRGTFRAQLAKDLLDQWLQHDKIV
ncbi:methylenetetrahydrofolate--tRNA-(uracil(54)-C(5))-methyltransferase (FADH(2)-oxidizing) TrmFO [Desulfogranum japonicum]|uniref:methylenetetrahydrofolate--tRNA-(uracil(54)- C(5))-methyltransferase (FADH(2)-oxidizing) TrmFO n=1 Tax=Desulfogranum japonicum TaxID=231447 RepID=UPI000422DE1E|nr:methylenetetrahydrofolate--tRNA-(uracil(54)-C(5))-methyltransferase (FADH(2)-oxidizing) TrmFO [Desulfogranum japonicum]